ncbi:MAG: hypothetical protein ACRD2E_03160 [Terriglobales bacterium]
MGRDTTPQAAQAQVAALIKLGPEGRLRAALEMSETARQVAIEGLRRWHPEWSFDHARRELVRKILGDGWARRVWPHGE